MKTRIEKAIEYIKGYCDKHSSCEKCRLYSDDNKCIVQDIPCDWECKEQTE